MNPGKEFEQCFKNSIPKDIYYYRIIDPAQSFNQDANNSLRFSIKNKFDAIMFLSPFMFCVELKSTKGTAFSFKGTSPMIKDHQVKELTIASTYKNIIAGFVFNFREPINKVYFLHINDFNKFVKDTTKSSINEKDIISYGAIEIKGILKKVKYKYDIEDFIEKAKEKI